MYGFSGIEGSIIIIVEHYTKVIMCSELVGTVCIYSGYCYYCPIDSSFLAVYFCILENTKY